MLYYNTVTETLIKALNIIMREEIFNQFCLVGGTNLSLRYGHRKSIDIDLFTDAEYGSLDFKIYEDFLKENFAYYECTDNSSIVGFGRSYYIGEDENNIFKLDLMYTDKFIDSIEIIDNIRMASVKDIIAMKADVILRGGRKKDFWDIHLLLNTYSIEDVISLHRDRYEWNHDKSKLISQFLNFEYAENDFNPICLLNKNWEDIKLDLIDTISTLNKD